jgi:glycosyltransferase involved in cell wall biosynthesis
MTDPPTTIDIETKIVQKYPDKIRIIQNERKLGYCRNFESAVSLVTGDVIFRDQDDVWSPDKVASMLRVFAEDPEGVLVYSDAVITDPELRPTGTVFNRRKDAELRKTPTLRQMSRGLAFNGLMMAFHSRLRPFVIPFTPLSLQWGHDHWIAFIAYAVGEIWGGRDGRPPSCILSASRDKRGWRRRVGRGWSSRFPGAMASTS